MNAIAHLEYCFLQNNHIEKLITAELFESPIFFDDSKELI